MDTLSRRVPAAISLAVIMAAVVVALVAPASPSNPAQASDHTIEVWWPTTGAEVSGTQPFKALLWGAELGDYEMSWRVDGGPLNPMVDNYLDRPHKEASVDLTDWTWNGKGPYEVTFVATSTDGTTVARRSVSINVSQPQDDEPEVGNLVVWWPNDGAELSGTQPLKAVLEGADLDDYEMLWQVDGGQKNAMADSYMDHPHKEASVDLTDWTWNGSGPYAVTFIAEGLDGAVLATKTIHLLVELTAPSTTTTTTPSTTTTTTPSTTTTASSSTGLAGQTLYVSPWSPAQEQADAWRQDHPYEASLLDKLAAQPTARWFGDWNNDIFADVSQATDAITSAGAFPVYVAYNIPQRDCSGYSGGGAKSADDYRSWVESFAMAIGTRESAVILEPDALALLDCLSEAGQAERLALLRDAVEMLGAGGATLVYIDAGHARWHSAEETAQRLRSAGVEAAWGFALNVSNFFGTDETVSYGQRVSELLGGKPFVIDTSRNGLGPSSDNEWCNPSGRAVGLPPTTSTGKAFVDAYLWIKVPGESDGTCNGGPAAGTFWPDYAVGLAERSDW